MYAGEYHENKPKLDIRKLILDAITEKKNVCLESHHLLDFMSRVLLYKNFEFLDRQRADLEYINRKT